MQEITAIQPLLWPSADNCAEEKMYFRRDTHTQFVLGQSRMCFQKGASVNFSTYFNGFSIEKWRKYTRVSRIYLKLKLSGTFQLFLLGFHYRNGAVISKVLQARILQAEDVQHFTLEFPEEDVTLYGFSLQALQENSIFEGGSYCCDRLPGNRPVPGLALNICTYRRENYLKSTLERLRRGIWENPESPIREHLHAYITDNGQTLAPKEIETDYIHLRRQNGAGSAGGFAAGQLAILRDREQYQLTHMIFMDDDIVFDPAVLDRAYWFLYHLKPDYRDYVLGSGLLRLHTPTIQVEAGAWWRDGCITSAKSGLDLTRLEHVLFNELEEGCNYQGWWFCCVPLENQGLPCPVYFHRDDIEFGLRQRGFVHLNGICVWHEEFENKPFSRNEYFDARNGLIVNAIHSVNYGKIAAFRDLTKSVFVKIFLYRYREAMLILRGFEDFCRGDDWVLEHDSGDFYTSLVQQGYLPIPVAEIGGDFNYSEYLQNLNPTRIGQKTYRRLRHLAGYFLPANRTVTVPMFVPQISCCYRAKYVIHFNSSDETAYVTERSYSDTLKVVKEYLRISLALFRRYNKAAKQWKARSSTYFTDTFWKHKLNFE